jgi:hypothetical protein
MPADKARTNNLLAYIWDMLSFYSVDEIKIPTDYYNQVFQIKSVLRSDTSGIVNSVLDFAIGCASVNFDVESKNPQSSDLISEWFKRINVSLIGRVPTGLKALSKEYYRERWKNSSFLVLRSIWEDVKIDGETLNLPTKMWFVDGMNIVVEDKGTTRIIGDEKYSIRTSEKETKPLPSNSNELIFIQKPFDNWSSLYPTPFLIQRGLYKNLQIFDLINKKGEKIIGKALEYLLMLKKGTERLALEGKPEYSYSEEDLKAVKKNLKDMINNSKTEAGTPTYVTNFDTNIEHLIPDYAKILNTGIYAPIEKRLLAGLGLIEGIDIAAGSRKETILNPRPFINEVENGIEDFGNMLEDIIKVIVERNIDKHPKFFSDNNDIQLRHAPVKEFIGDSIRDHLRSMYDRGTLSKQTYNDVVGDIDLDIEVKRRKQETKDNLDEEMYPPVTQNAEAKSADLTPFKKQPIIPVVKNEKIPVSKQGLEKLNFKSSIEEIELSEEEVEELNKLEISDEDLETSKIVKQKDGYHVISEKTGKNLGGPYATKKEAINRLREVEFYKNKGKKDNE